MAHIKTTVRKIKHTCSFCAKTFSRKKFFNDHILFCEQIHKSQYVQHADEEEAKDKATVKQLYSVIKTLLTRVETLEEKYNDLHKYVENIKKKINIVDWLTENRTPKTEFKSWLSNIVLTRAHMDLVIKHDYLNGVGYVLQQFLPLENVATLPICCFQQKKQIFFIYQNEKWQQINDDQMLSILQHIDKKLVGLFLLWKEEHKYKIETDHSFYMDVMMHNFNKIIGQKYTRERQISAVKSSIYQYLKCNLKNIIHYEFTF